MINQNTKETKATIIAIANTQAAEIQELKTQQRILFIISGLLFVSHYLF